MPGIYISFPFCSQKCTFCNFASGVFPRDVEQDYAEALLDEIRGHSWAWTPETLYLGGGTPSQIPLDLLERFLAMLPGRPWAEATIEATPGSLTPERVDAWRDLGINRVSLGVQSFVKKEIARTGRKHDADIVASDVALLRRHGIPNVNIDLIAGLALQTKDSWRASLDRIEEIEPPHVSVYLLEVDEDSRLGLEVIKGGSRYGARQVPNGDIMADLYDIAVDRLASLGLRRYEISNFARPGWESKHNLKYWKLEPYAGFGADAHSFDGTLRRANVESPGEYVERWREHQPFVVETTPANLAEERFFVGLRLAEGIEPLDEEWQRWSGPIDRFLEAGLLETHGRRLKLSKEGVLLSNEVLQEFIQA